MSDQPSLPFQPHSTTSQAAAESMRPVANRQRLRVLAVLRAAPDGMTDQEIQDALNMDASTERPRRGELITLRLVSTNGKTRPTRSGRQATVWIAT